MKQNIIPLLPSMFVITEELARKENEWKTFLTSISPRIKLIDRTRKDFKKQLDQILLDFKTECAVGGNPSHVEIKVWPEERQIAFIVAIDSSLPGEEKTYLVKDVIIFLYNNFAFMVNDIEYIEEEDEVEFYGFVDYATHWSYKWGTAVKNLKRRLQEIQSQVIPLSKRD